MTSEELRQSGFAPLTDELLMPDDEETLESVLRQLSRGKHAIDFHVLRTGLNEREVWAKPVTQAYDDKL